MTALSEKPKEFLKNFFFRPDNYLPFQEFSNWVQLELFRKNYAQAEKSIRSYIRSSSVLLDENGKEITSIRL